MMISVMTFVCMKWTRENEARPTKRFNAKHVNAVLRMLKNTQSRPIRLICLTDDSNGLDPAIEVLPIPKQGRQTIDEHGMQFFKLYLFSEEFRTTVGMNFVYCDLDVAILGDIANVHDDVGHLTIMEGKNGAFFDNLQAVHGSQLPAKRSASLFFKLLATERSPKDAFKYARLGSRPWCRYNSSFMIISRDQPDDLWRWLPPEAGDEIRAANLWGSDQAWLHLHKKGRIKTVGKDDGFWYAGEVGKYHRRHRALPDNLNMVIFPGLGSKPWLAEQRGREWVRKVYNID